MPDQYRSRASLHLGPYIAGIENGSILPSDLREHIALVAQQPVHISYEAEVFFIPRSLTYRHPPLLYGLQYSHLYAGWPNGRSFGESSNQFIEELLGADLEMECVSTIFDTDIQQLDHSQPSRHSS